MGGVIPEILLRQGTPPRRGKSHHSSAGGTRPRGARRADKAAEQGTEADPKACEHVMLIDGAQQHIGRIAQIGNVKDAGVYVPSIVP